MSCKFPTHKLRKIRTVGSPSYCRTWGDKQPPGAIIAGLWISRRQGDAEDK